jgi:hypothetical protein
MNGFLKTHYIFLIVIVFIILINSCIINPDDSGVMTAQTVVTLNVSEITQASAMSGGNVRNDGGADVTSGGVYWGTGENPPINNDTTKNGSGTGVFTSDITGLHPGTIYYVRVYAVNS